MALLARPLQPWVIALYVPLSLQQIDDTNGTPIRTARLYVYETGTTTPKDVFASSDLNPARKRPWPIPVDATGRLPAVFVGQGDYDVLITDGTSADPIGAPGAVLFSAQGLPGDPADVPPPSYDPLRQTRTGEYVFMSGSGTPNGCVSANGGTIGGPTSQASTRANADCQALFVYLWEGRSDLAVFPGRGGSALGDFAAGNTITLPDLNSRLLAFVAPGSPTGNLLAAGLQDPNSPPGVLLGSFGGEATHVLSEAELATHTHTATFAGDAVGNHVHVADVSVDTPGHTHVLGTTKKQVISAQASSGAIPASFYAVPDGEAVGASSETSAQTTNHSHAVTIQPAGAFTPSGSVTVANDGSSKAHNNLPPFVVGGAVFIKL